MINKILIIASFIAIALYEVPKLIKVKQKKEIVVVSVLLILGLSVALLAAFGMRLPLIQLPQI